MNSKFQVTKKRIAEITPSAQPIKWIARVRGSRCAARYSGKNSVKVGLRAAMVSSRSSGISHYIVVSMERVKGHACQSFRMRCPPSLTDRPVDRRRDLYGTIDEIGFA